MLIYLWRTYIDFLFLRTFFYHFKWINSNFNGELCALICTTPQSPTLSLNLSPSVSLTNILAMYLLIIVALAIGISWRNPVAVVGRWKVKKSIKSLPALSVSLPAWRHPVCVFPGAGLIGHSQLVTNSYRCCVYFCLMFCHTGLGNENICSWAQNI